MHKRASYLQTEFRAAESEDKLYVEGYFIKFNSETELFPGVYEEVAPEAVVKTLKTSDVRSLFNHDTNLVLGRTGNKTLELKADDVGLWGRVEINRNDQQAMDAYHRIARGDVPGCSFGFYPRAEEIVSRDGGGDKFILREIELFEVSPCVFPAYPQTEVSARQQDLNQLKREKLMARKRQLKERLRHG
jgi:hypothetical protein